MPEHRFWLDFYPLERQHAAAARFLAGIEEHIQSYRFHFSGPLPVLHLPGYRPRGTIRTAHQRPRDGDSAPTERTLTTENRAPNADRIANRVREILVQVKRLAAEYYQLTGKPLGATGEIAEQVAAECLGLILVPARTAGHDAIRALAGKKQRIQIKARAWNGNNGSQRIGTIKSGAACDRVLLVLMDHTSFEPLEMWEAPYTAVVRRLEEPGSRARNERGSLSISGFKRLRGAEQVWP